MVTLAACAAPPEF